MTNHKARPVNHRYVSIPPDKEKHETLNMHILQRQESLFILPPLHKGYFLPLHNGGQYFQRQNNAQKPEPNANKKLYFVHIITLKECDNVFDGV